MSREPFTEPYTRRERVSIKWTMARYNVRRWFGVGLWQSLMRHAPHRLIYFATIHAYGTAWATSKTKTPNELTFEEVVKPWEA